MEIKPETKRIKIHMGYTCNSNCQFCYYSSMIHDLPLPTEILRQEIILARKLGYYDIDFTGGEPTVFSDLQKLISFAKEEGFKDIAIITNGIRLADNNYFSTLKNAGLNDVLFSVHGANAQVHDYLTRVPGSFNKITTAMKNAEKLGVKIRTNITINTYNYKTLTEYAQLISQYKVSAANFIFFNPWTTSNVELEKLTAKFSQAVPFLENALDILDSKIPKITIRYVPYCIISEKYKNYICDFKQRAYDPDEWAEPFSAFSELVASKFSKSSNSVTQPKIPNINQLFYKFYIYNYIITLLRNLKTPQEIIKSLKSTQESYQNAASLLFNIKKKECRSCAFFNDCDGIKTKYATIFDTTEFKPI